MSAESPGALLLSGKSVLFVTAAMEATPSGGRALLSHLLMDALSSIEGLESFTLEVAARPLRGSRSFAALFNGHIDGVSGKAIRLLVAKVTDANVDIVFLDGSNFGALAKALKRECKGVEVVTFFHNCETRFFLGSLRQHPSVRALGVLVANRRAESLSVRSSDKRICLNQRDSQQLHRTYGRGGTHILPMAMHDQLPKHLPAAPPGQRERYALFVGGTFYANRQGIEWFVEHVAAKSPIKTCVVGKGFEEWKSRLERNGNVEVIGSVDSLAPWYLGAHVVIAPIFDGSGMKTKVAEALMFGKRIVGTPEAFVGYEAIVDRVGTVCETASQFLEALEREAARPFVGIDRDLRSNFEERYSFQAARDQLARILIS